MECTTSALVTGRASLAGSRIRSGIACNMAAGALWGLVFLAPEVVRDFGPLRITLGRYIPTGSSRLRSSHHAETRSSANSFATIGSC